MGVTGLWRLVEPSGKPVPLETLENKVLAVDVSIWLHQAIKGFQDSQGAPLPNAHLLGIYHRVCKLLYFRIKPVFVFDGGVPNLKKETICKRNQQKSKKLSEAERIQKQLLTTLLKHSAVNKVLSETTKATLTTKPNLSKLANKQTTEDIYKLPPTDFDSTISDDDETSESVDSSPTKHWDLHTIDEKSTQFKALPADVRHDILTDLKETRKQSSWGKIHEMPKQSDDFSSFQMKRLLKRYSVQVSLEEAEKEMGGRSLSLAELETLLKDQGVDTSCNSLGSRIASDENTRYLLIKDVKKAMDEASKRESPVLESIQEKEEEEEPNCLENNKITEISNGETETVENQSNNPDSEFQRDLEKAIQLSLQDVPSTSKDTPKSETASKSKKANFSFLEDFDDADFHSSSESEDDSSNRRNSSKILASAKSYMVEYSGLTPSEIAKIIGGSTNSLGKNKINGASENVNSRLSPTENNEVESSTSLNENEEIKRSETLQDDGEDGTVSSSTTNIVKLSNKVTVNPVDTNEVTSSNEVLTDKCDNKVIEIISDADSSSDEFLEVSETNPKSSQFEILIKPEESIEDDIFSDIFCDKPDSISTNTNGDFIKPQAQRASVSTEFVEQVSSSAQDEPTKINAEFHDGKSASAILSDNVTNSVGGELIKDTNKEREKTVLEEFIKPKQIQEITGATNDSSDQKGNEKQVLTTERLLEIEANLQQEETELISERFTKERMANNLTEQIYQEAQELLQLFGLPYIVAPMEAEAQCAFLNDIDLTDGTITDDSDIWLFGGKTVYKNFFNQHKHVMEFRAENILHHFKLSREQMILLALLVGSDYTVGIQGIGPVTALEVLAAFPPSKNTDQQLTSGLNEFRKWLIGERAAGPGRTTLRNKLKNVTLIESFPSLQVVKAYLEPTVDSSREPFTWGKPDMIALMEFARRKFGWTRVKSEEILKPVLKRLNETHIQRSIKDYFKTKHKIDGGEIESALSKRVKKAINRIEKGDVDSDEDKSKKIRKKRQHKGKAVAETTKKDDSSAVADEAANTEIAGLSSDEDIQILKKTRTESKKKLQQIETEVKSEIEQQAKKERPTVNLHKKTVIPQKERDKIDALRTKMKAIEVYRKSKKGPGYLQKRTNVARQAKEDAGLSESSSSD